MVDDMVEDSDEELVMHTSPSRAQLSKPTNKIVKLCSPIFRVELVKKGIDHQKIRNDRLLCQCQGSGTP
jgi:hypothetical protein